MISKAELAKMKKGAYLLNAARGTVVDLDVRPTSKRHSLLLPLPQPSLCIPSPNLQRAAWQTANTSAHYAAGARRCTQEWSSRRRRCGRVRCRRHLRVLLQRR